MEKYLVVKGSAGIGNRLSTLCRAIEYCKDTDRSIMVDWSDGYLMKEGYNFFNDFFRLKGVRCVSSFSEMGSFEKRTIYPCLKAEEIVKGTYELFHSLETPTFNRVPLHFWPKSRIRMLRRYWHYLDGKKETAKHSVMGLTNSKNAAFGGDLSLKKKEDIVLFMDYIPEFNSQTLLDHVHLNKEVERKVEKCVSDLLGTRRSVGVHVRNTDKKPKKSINHLLEMMDSQGFGRFRVFLATDDNLIIRAFVNKFRDVVVYPKSIPDVSSGGIHHWGARKNDEALSIRMIEDSIIDMYSLSRCEYLFFQGNSSFSRIASIMHLDKCKAVDWQVSV